MLDNAQINDLKVEVSTTSMTMLVKLVAQWMRRLQALHRCWCILGQEPSQVGLMPMIPVTPAHGMKTARTEVAKILILLLDLAGYKDTAAALSVWTQ